MAGFDLTHAPGTPVWFESLTRAFDAALPFYTDVLGWEPSWLEGSADSSDGFRYVTNGAGPAAVAGLCAADAIMAPGVPSFWRVYFGVEDADEVAARAASLGGQIQAAPADSPFGRFAQLADPQGALFMINEAPTLG